VPKAAILQALQPVGQALFLFCQGLPSARYNKNYSQLENFMWLDKSQPAVDRQMIGLHQLACHVPAEVVGMNLAQDEEERSVALRLLEIGFLPGESVRVIAHGFPGHDPLAVRVGHTTFALRSHEAALVQVRPT